MLGGALASLLLPRSPSRFRCWRSSLAVAGALVEAGCFLGNVDNRVVSPSHCRGTPDIERVRSHMHSRLARAGVCLSCKCNTTCRSGPLAALRSHWGSFCLHTLVICPYIRRKSVSHSYLEAAEYSVEMAGCIPGNVGTRVALHFHFGTPDIERVRICMHFRLDPSGACLSYICNTTCRSGLLAVLSSQHQPADIQPL